MKDMLESMCKLFDLHVFTSSDKTYADLILKQIDPQDKYFKERWYRSSCTKAANGQFIKDLRPIGSSLSRTVLVDNSCFSFGHQLLNGVPITGFTGDPADTELMSLQDYLQHISKVTDVRRANLEYFKLPTYVELETPDLIFEKLFSQSN
jgi:Dullard-like phosphatase family protein